MSRFKGKRREELLCNYLVQACRLVSGAKMRSGQQQKCDRWERTRDGFGKLMTDSAQAARTIMKGADHRRACRNFLKTH